MAYNYHGHPSNTDNTFLEETWDDSQNVISIETQLPLNVEPIPAGRSNQKRAKNFSKNGDNLLVSAWLNTSIDAVIGNEQSNSFYWRRIHEYYCDNKTFQSERNQISFANRWGTIREQVNKFVGCYDQVMNRRQSGMTAQDQIGEACSLFQSVENRNNAFAFMHCWMQLRHHSKWTARLSQKKQKKNLNDSPATSTPGTNSSHYDVDVDALTPEVNPLKRQGGKKAAKEEQRDNSSSSSKNSSVIVALNNLWSSKIEIEVVREAKKEGHLERALAQEDEKIVIEKEPSTCEIERLALEKKRVAQEEQRLEWKQRIDDERIMGIDISVMNGPQQLYYKLMQDKIIARWSNNSD